MGVSDLFEKGLDLVGAGYDQMSKPVQQGAAELAAALFQGDGFMPVGIGQQEANVSQINVLEGLFADQGVEVQAVEAPLPTPQVEQQMEMER